MSSRRTVRVAAALAAAVAPASAWAVNQVNMIPAPRPLVRMDYASAPGMYGGTYDYQVFGINGGAPAIGFLNVISDLNLNGSIAANEWIVQNIPMPLGPSLMSYPMLSAWWDPGTFNLTPGQPYPTAASIEDVPLPFAPAVPPPGWALSNNPTGQFLWGGNDPLGQTFEHFISTPNATAAGLQAVKHAGVPDIAQQTNECGPTSAANSLRWLESQYPISMAGKLPASNDDLIKGLMKAMTGSDARPFGGLSGNQLYDGKKKYAKDMPIVVKGGQGSAAASGAKAFDFIKVEIDAGEDVEMLVDWPGTGTGSHWVTVTGYGVTATKMTLEVNDPDDGKTGPVDWTVTAAGAITAPAAATVMWAVSESVTPLWDFVPPGGGGGNRDWAFANWSNPGFPDSFFDIAHFGDGIAGSVGVVNLNGDRTVNTIQIDHAAGSYDIVPVGASMLFLEDGYGAGSILHGSATTDYIRAPLVAMNEVYIGVYDAIGELHLAAPLRTPRLSTGGDGTVYIDAINGSPSPSGRVMDLEVRDGHTIFTQPQHLDTVVVRGGRLTAAPPAEVIDVEILSLNLVSVNPIVVDLTDNKMIVHGMSYSTLEPWVVLGFNGGDWMGEGITSSTAANDTIFATALGIVDNAETGYTEYGGVTGLSGTEILIGYTYYGDANNGGSVNLDDFNQFLFGFNPANAAPQIWLNGDFNYTNSVNLDDFNLFLYGLLNQGGPLVSAELFAALSDFVRVQGVDVDLSTVPEPVGLPLLLAGAGVLASRRHRNNTNHEGTKTRSRR